MDSGSILKLAKRFFAGTLLSRISGGIRDVVTAICFGSCPEIGAFMVAYRLIHLFRRLLGEGNLASGFVPHFELLQRENPKRSLEFYRDSSFSFFVVSLFFVLVLEVILWGLLFFLSPEWQEIVVLMMKMAPGLVFLCLYALNGAFLQCQRKLFSFAAAPIFFNFFWIAMALFSSSLPRTQAVEMLALAMTGAFALQWGFTVYLVHRGTPFSMKEWFYSQLFSVDWKKMMKPVLLGILGIGATQVNSALDAIFSRFADLSGPAYLWYAIRFEQLPLAFIGIALTGAALAPLSQAIQEGNKELYIAYLQKILRSAIALLLPCVFAFFVLGSPILNVFYGHGGFSALDVLQTKYCLWGYALGLLPSVFVLLLATGFYAKRSYGLPALASGISVIFNILLNIVMVFGLHLGAFSIALGTSFAGFLNFYLLWRALSRFLGVNVFSEMGKLWGRLFLVCSLTSSLTLCVEWVFFQGNSLSRYFQDQIMQLIVMGGVFIAAFSLGVYAFGIQEILEIVGVKKLEKSHF